MSQQPNKQYPPQGGYPPPTQGYNPQPGYNQQGGYPPQQGGYPPQQGGYPPQGGYPVRQQPYPGQPNVFVIGGMGQQMDPVEMASLQKCRNCAMFCSVTSLICTWLLCFSIPALVCACRGIYEPNVKSSYKSSIILASVSWVITLVWVIVVAVYVSIFVSAAVAYVNSATSLTCSYSSASLTPMVCANLKTTYYEMYKSCC